VICQSCRRGFVDLIRLCFFAEGVLVLLVGLALVFVDRFVTVSLAAESQRSFEFAWTTVNAELQYVFDPPEWVGYALVSVGVITVLYTIALPRRKRGEG
jgi:hypothetical protein